MANTTYETILHDAQKLTDEERRRLRDALTSSTERTEINAFILPLPPVGAFAAALQLSEPLPADFLDAMERAIEEDFEGIESGE